MGRFWMLWLVSLSLSSCYSLTQAYWFNNAFNSRQTLQEAMVSSELSASERHKLALVGEILVFASQQGLNTGNSYQHFISSGPGTVSYLVQAAYPDRMELLTWWFPVIGKVPYLGFFAKSDRDVKVVELQRQDFDVSLGTVGAFSSLGWFADPIYASMLRHSNEEFVQLLLHELVHRSFWSSGSAAFNENLAEFVSLKLLEIFLLEHRHGEGLKEFKQNRQDRELLRQWIFALKADLEKLYSLKGLDKKTMLLEKNKIIEEYRQHKFPGLQNSDFKAARNRSWNNASILGAALYAPDTEKFEKALSCLPIQDMRNFLIALRQAEHGHDEAETSLKSLCQEKIPNFKPEGH